MATKRTAATTKKTKSSVKKHTFIWQNVWDSLPADRVRPNSSGGSWEVYAEAFLNNFTTDYVNRKDIIVVKADGRNSTPKMIRCPLGEALLANAVSGNDVYFYVNGGGTKVSKISDIKCNFIDLDAGKDKNGNYLQANLVSKRKQKMRDHIERCPIIPSLIVETRNGYHLYWLYDKYLNGHDWRDIQTWNNSQNELSIYFKNCGADVLAMRLNQLMRLPGSEWQKKWAGRTHFRVAYYNTQYVYNAQQLSQALVHLNVGGPIETLAKAFVVANKQKAPTSKTTKAHTVWISGVGSVPATDETMGLPLPNPVDRLAFKHPLKLGQEVDPVGAQSDIALQTTQETIDYLIHSNRELHRLGEVFLAKTAYVLAKRLAKLYNLSIPFYNNSSGRK